MKILKIIALSVVCTLFASCSQKPITYKEISQEEAKRIMDTETCIILDVRTAEEYNEGHIENAINIDHEEIKEKASALLPDKKAKILVYCRSGRRSKIAAETLAEMGYTNVLEFGGIIDWKY